MTDHADRTARADPGLAVTPLGAATPMIHLEVIAGPDAGTSQWLEGDRPSVGTHAKNALVLSDPTISRFHCELVAEARGWAVRDLGSTNGTFVDEVPVRDAWLRAQSTVRIGNTVLRVQGADHGRRRAPSAKARFGRLIGTSLPMRSLFADLEKAAAVDATVLLTGETGTGKEETAVALHEAGPRAEGPFVVVDCAALAPQIAESELFGHEKGAFTDAIAARAGAFEAAHGGTVFLDEIGELPLEQQAKLLRVLETREVRRVGSHQVRTVDVRVVAATHRDLRAEVNAGRFREDLYYRLAVIELRLPALRERMDDLPALAAALLGRITPGGEELLDAALLERLAASSWPGNVRQLRNYLERVVHLDRHALPPGHLTTPQPAAEAVTATVDYEEARRRALDAFERRYLEDLLRRCDDNVSEAARRAGINRSYLHRLCRRHGLR